MIWVDLKLLTWNKHFYYPPLHFSETGKSVKTTENNNNNITPESGVRQVELGVSSALDTSKVRDEMKACIELICHGFPR